MSILQNTAEAPSLEGGDHNLNNIDLLANVSHEIRNPLNAIIGLSKLLKTTDSGEEKEEYLNALIQTSENLLEMANNLLDFSKLKSGKLTFDRTAVDIRETLPRSLYGQKLLAESKNIEFRMDFDPEVPQLVVLDSVKTNQIVMNLVSNAMKFTENGSVRLGVKVLDKTPREVLLQFSVKDTGIGIPQENLENIFDPFNQGHETINFHYGGTGLGLTICRKLLEMMGSSLQVKSEWGKGSEFFFELPVLIGSGMPLKLKDDEELLPREGLKVLVVDDNKLNRLVAMKNLEQWEVSVETATNGQEALQCIQEQDFDLVLMDLRMPVLDGHQTITRLRELKDKKYQDIPVVAVTGSLCQEEQDKLVLEGFTDYLLKPYRAEELLEKLLFLFPR